MQLRHAVPASLNETKLTWHHPFSGSPSRHAHNNSMVSDRHPVKSAELVEAKLLKLGIDREPRP
jgi:hypothetical protein